MNTSFFLTPVGRAPPATSTPYSRLRTATKKRTYVRPVCDTCQTCGKEYRCHRAYLNHVRGHKIIEQSSRFPKIQKIMEHLSKNFGNVLKDMVLAPAYGNTGLKYKAFLQLVIDSHEGWDDFHSFKDPVHQALTKGLQDNKFLLPSSLSVDLQRNAELLLADLQERSALYELFKLSYPVDENLFQMFLSGYVLYLITDIVKFISTSVMESLTPPSEKPFEVTNDYLEAVHYIAGSRIRAFYKKSLRFSGNSAWKTIGTVISERLLESDSVQGPPANVKGWTAAQSRGRLFYVSDVMFDFFCGVAIALEKQKSKLKVNYEGVVQNVCDSGIVLLWDAAVGDSMPPSDSFNFMRGLIIAFCQTFGSGKVKRLVNEMKPKGEASIALRHKVAPKSKSSVEPSTSK